MGYSGFLSSGDWGILLELVVLELAVLELAVLELVLLKLVVVEPDLELTSEPNPESSDLTTETICYIHVLPPTMTRYISKSILW